ncbi:TPA: hypothetical protein QH810_005272 [Klebsiella pneumoniae subsp. pneumoniae]|uniref:Uncharacterized protein n=1 Tax=Klebsiella pneumoniae TaxID=573 RepID=A0A220SUP1_KLEPN|nr:MULTISPECIES: hypothetical protein [Klebsiella]ASK37202.1 hypothetical protein [Klebsiella pneumoniae]ELA0306322.1 hypothetical protein [Klebsiella pneumoniae]MBZ2008513.1 hypothetical protein [Klebsiella pneumoniae]MCF1382316.1 hypothetical protein [Klebsiella pneumoniae]MCF2237305.1 hypothetical protein [Klebsiella pneumoniae]
MSQIFFDTINNGQYDFMMEWNTAAMDKWVAENIGLSRCQGEAELFDTKWFDYRDMHPLMATCLFTEAYKRSYSQIMLSHGREHFETAPFSTGLKRLPYQELSAVNKTSLWKARQFADRYCCSYDYFISTVLSAAACRLWDKLPRPQHLWQPELIEIFESKLANRAGTRLDDSVVSFKHLGDMQYDPIQERYFEWVLERLKHITRDKRIRTIFSAVWLMELVPERVIYAHYPEELEEARRLC